MGPLLMTGLHILGATVAIGLVASRVRPLAAPPTIPPTPRNLAIIAIAFCSGIGVLGAVVGILAIEAGQGSDAAGPALATVPAALGAIVGLALITRRWGEADRSVASIGAVFIVSQFVLAAVIGLLSVVLDEPARSPASAWLFAALGAVAAVSTIVLGVRGARGVELMATAPPGEARAVMSRQIARIAPFQAVGVICAMAAIALVVGAPR